MSSTIGIPTSRISNLYVTQRLSQQVSSSVGALFQVELQLSTGERISLGSEDPLAAQRIVSTKRLIAQNNQVKTDLTSASYLLGQTDSALTTVSKLLTSIQATAIGVTGDTSTDSERSTAAVEVSATISSLLSIANQQYNNTYLFAGTSTATNPYVELTSGYVQYNGNEEHTATYGNLGGLLIQTNVTGAETFGGYSAAVMGLSNLTPTLSENTLLSDLNGGEGVSLGSIAVNVVTSSHGTYTSTIDLSNASTVGDVARLIQNATGLEGKINVDIGDDGLNISLASGTTAEIYVNEVGNGNTAESLGILCTTGETSITGTDLDPVLTATTKLSDLLGGKSKTVCRFDGTDNDIVVSSAANGTTLDGVTVQFVDGASPGSEYATYTADTSGNVTAITVHVSSEASTAADVIDAINNDLASIGIEASLDAADNLNGGKGIVTTLASQTMSGGWGTNIDLTSGLQICNNGATYEVTFDDATTVQDVLNILNSSEAGVTASINADGTGINVRSNIAGCDFSIGENGGATASDLGIRSLDSSTKLSDLNEGGGVDEITGTDFTITTVNGTTLNIDIGDCDTFGEVITAINDAATAAGLTTFAAIAATEGNGIVLTDTDTTTGGTITVSQYAGCSAANDLGLIPQGETSASSVSGASSATLTGRDVNPSSAAGVFDSLIRLQKALEENDTNAIGKAIDLLDAAMEQVTYVQADVGFKENAITTLLTQQSNLDTQLKTSLSNDFDTDYAEAASELTARQLAYQASLKVSGMLLQMTLLDYI
jgi:flagellin-like hook-associated protein FlgL